MKKIALLKALLKVIARDYHSHLLSHYAYELAHLFHSYYASNKVIDPTQVEQTRARLYLIEIVQNTLGVCLDLFGLEKPTHM